jgi:glycosyltransferase involved in cell wall biosynthesis
MTPSAGSARNVRLAYLVSHPIQYQAPLLARIAREPGIDLTVFFASDHSLRPFLDPGFGVEISWDVPLLEGYRSHFLPRRFSSAPLKDVSAFSPISKGIRRALTHADGSPAFDALWVHGYATVNSLLAIFHANALGIPVLLRADMWLGDRPRSPFKLAIKRLFLKLLRNGITATLPVGSVNAAYWRHYFGDDFPQFLMPYAVDNKYFARQAAAAAPHQTELRAELGLEPGRPVILFASKLQSRKHADDLVQAYAYFLENRPAAAAPYLLIVGDGEERSRLEAHVRQLGLTGVRFLGFRNQSELPRFFSLADVFVLPARHEPWGLIVNEAMAAGCAVIVSTEVGAHADLVTHGVEGCVFPAGNIAALTEALRTVFASPEIPRRMGESARRRIAHWTFEHNIRGLRQALAFATHKIKA